MRIAQQPPKRFFVSALQRLHRIPHSLPFTLHMPQRSRLRVVQRQSVPRLLNPALTRHSCELNASRAVPDFSAVVKLCATIICQLSGIGTFKAKRCEIDQQRATALRSPKPPHGPSLRRAYRQTVPHPATLPSTLQRSGSIPLARNSAIVKPRAAPTRTKDPPPLANRKSFSHQCLGYFPAPPNRRHRCLDVVPPIACPSAFSSPSSSLRAFPYFSE